MDYLPFGRPFVDPSPASNQTAALWPPPLLAIVTSGMPSRAEVNEQWKGIMNEPFRLRDQLLEIPLGMGPALMLPGANPEVSADTFASVPAGQLGQPPDGPSFGDLAPKFEVSEPGNGLTPLEVEINQAVMEMPAPRRRQNNRSVRR